MELEELIKQYRAAQKRVRTLQTKISFYDDGFVYLVKITIRGGNNWLILTNAFTVQEYCDRYEGGDDGLCSVWTTNTESGITGAWRGPMYMNIDVMLGIPGLPEETKIELLQH